MLKRILIAAFLFAVCYTASAQHYYREGERPSSRDDYADDQTYGDGFKTEHLFIGGNLGLGYDSYTFSAGISPEIGYSFTKWLDAGALINLNYSSERADPYYNSNTRLRSFNYGIGHLHVCILCRFFLYKRDPNTTGLITAIKLFQPGRQDHMVPGPPVCW